MADKKKPKQIEAAGGLVIRSGSDGTEVLLVHRPKYDDWSFPKGKLEPGEAHVDAAVREVEEETGFSCSADEELGEVRYDDAQGRPKRVRYWTMWVDAGDFEPTGEVDEIRWLPVDDAAELLTYSHDRDLLFDL